MADSSARQLVARLELCGVTPQQLDGVLLTHEHGDHVCGLEVLCRKFHVPIYCNALTAEAIRCGSLGEHRNWRIFRTGADFSICDITVQTFPVPHDAVEPVGYAFHAGKCGLGFITDLGYPTKMLVERLRHVHTLVIETNHDEKLLQACQYRPWPVKQRIMSRHGHLSNAAAASVIEQLLPGQNRARGARPSQPGLQYARPRERRGRSHAGEVRTRRRGDLLRRSARGQHAVPHRRDAAGAVPVDLRRSFLSGRARRRARRGA